MTTGPDLIARLAAYHAALQPFDADQVSAAYATDAIYTSPGIGRVLQGKVAILAAFTDYFTRYPDQQSQDNQIALTGPLTACTEWSLTATDQLTGQTTTRKGRETVTFTPAGLITAITVEDHP